MQTPAWYFRRLRAMSPREIAWRLGSAARDRWDLLRFRNPAAGRRLAAQRAGDARQIVPGFRCGAPAGSRTEPGLVTRAEDIAAGKLSYFCLRNAPHGQPIDWNRDHRAGKAAPLRLAAKIDYRDFSETGDCKFVWEPNRHHHWVVLARAYRATGQRRFAQAVADQFDSWIEQCPYPFGMNWRSPLELGIRLINWVWAVDLTLESGIWDAPRSRRLLECAALHIWEIARKYSRGSSANNHLIGEAAGVFIGACYFANLPAAAERRSEAVEILAGEILRQVHEDGGTREQALGYQGFVAQFCLLGMLAGRSSGCPMPASSTERLGRAFEYLAVLRAGGPLPLYGDSDDGYVLDLADNPRNIDPWLRAASQVFDCPQWAGAIPEGPNIVDLLPGVQESAPQGSRTSPRAGVAEGSRGLPCVAFPRTGLYLLQCGEPNSTDRLSVAVDVGELGYGAIAAHGHADALSVTLRAFGVDVLVDPGTYDYFTYRAWREHFRGTRAHNTVTVDGVDQSEPLGLFLWGLRANARCVSWEVTAEGAKLVAEHDGYRRLKDPVVHRRTIAMEFARRSIHIIDEIDALGEHEVAISYQLSESCRVRDAGDGLFWIDVGPGTVSLKFDPRLRVQRLEGSAPDGQPAAGWVSRGYHQKNSAVNLCAAARTSGRTAYISEIEVAGGMGWAAEDTPPGVVRARGAGE